MPVKKSTTKKTLSEIRAENMAKWTAEDYAFYNDFLADVPLKKKKKEGVAELRGERMSNAE